MDVRHEDVLIVAALILVDREAEADGHQFVREKRQVAALPSIVQAYWSAYFPPSSCSRMLHFFTCPVSLF